MMWSLNYSFETAETSTPIIIPFIWTQERFKFQIPQKRVAKDSEPHQHNPVEENFPSSSKVLSQVVDNQNLSTTISCETY